MNISSRSILKFVIFLLVVLSLFTFAQAYYSAYIHIALLALCFLCSPREQNITLGFIAAGGTAFLLFALLSIIKSDNAIMEHVGFFLHYLTWPFLFVCVIRNYKVREIKILLYLIIALCIIGDIASLIQLNVNPDISRLLAGGQLGGEKTYYYKLGVGGYGYVYAMSFLTYGIVRWLKNTNNTGEKIYLTIFLVINSLFILNAAYTTAIIITILLAGLALISGLQKVFSSIAIVFSAILLIVFGQFILEAGYNIASNLELEWVAKRLGQLLYVKGENDISSLRRYELYSLSFNSFLRNPLTGAGESGGHSEVLDMFARYGVFAAALVAFLVKCKSLCNKFLEKNKITALFIVFFVFACIDTCDSMQIPVSVFFAVPMIMYAEKEQE